MYPRLPLYASRAVVALSSVLLFGCGSGDAGSGAGEALSGGGALGSPTATIAEDFGSIQTVREMPDGRVLVADALGGALYAIDMDAGTRKQIGAQGQGPEEYRQPDAAWTLPGDSTLLVDLGNGRMISLGPDLSFGSTSPLSAGDPRTGMVIALPQGVDAEGYVYARSMGGGMMGSPPDSGAVLRIERGTFTVDTVATFKLEDRTVSRSGGPGEQNVRLSAVPLSFEDAWGVAADGSVVIVRSGDYHIEWVGRDGSVTAGAPTPYDPVSIGTGEKEEWSRGRTQTGGGIGISLEIGPEGARTSFGRGMGGGGGDEEDLDQYDWPEVKPPFYSGRVVVDPDSRAWVRRHVEAGEPATYDVFDRSAAHVATYTLPNNKRVIGFGTSSIYVVAVDEFDLNYLERYTMPM